MQLKPTDLHSGRDTNQEKNQNNPQILNPQKHSTRYINPDAIRNFLHVGPDVKTHLFYGSTIMLNYVQISKFKKLNKLIPFESQLFKSNFLFTLSRSLILEKMKYSFREIQIFLK